MNRPTEYLNDRPRDAVYWLDAALITAVYIVMAAVGVAALWVLAAFALSEFGGAAAMALGALQPERIYEPNPDAEDQAHDAAVQRKLDDETEQQIADEKRGAAQLSPEQLSIKDAHAEGMRAGGQGTAAGCNPFQSETPEYDAWERGRCAAEGHRLARVATR